jgi:hypothetical protein
MYLIACKQRSKGIDVLTLTLEYHISVHSDSQSVPGLDTKDIRDCPLARDNQNLAVRQADFHANLPDGQPNSSHFC